MHPYIESLDITKPIGKLVFNYGFDQYCKGIITGIIIGISFSGGLYLLLK